MQSNFYAERERLRIQLLLPGLNMHVNTQEQFHSEIIFLSLCALFPFLFQSLCIKESDCYCLGRHQTSFVIIYSKTEGIVSQGQKCYFSRITDLFRPHVNFGCCVHYQRKIPSFGKHVQYFLLSAMIFCGSPRLQNDNLFST